MNLEAIKQEEKNAIWRAQEACRVSSLEVWTSRPRPVMCLVCKKWLWAGSVCGCLGEPKAADAIVSPVVGDDLPEAGGIAGLVALGCLFALGSAPGFCVLDIGSLRLANGS